MMKRRQAIATLVASGICVQAAIAQSQAVNVLESTPTAHAVIGSRSSEFFVRFDRPVDHVKSRLEIFRDGKVIETLHPRLESAPEVLFARASTLPAGDYLLHWTVVTLQGTDVIAGDIPFKVAD